MRCLNWKILISNAICWLNRFVFLGKRTGFDFGNAIFSMNGYHLLLNSILTRLRFHWWTYHCSPCRAFFTDFKKRENHDARLHWATFPRHTLKRKAVSCKNPDLIEILKFLKVTKFGANLGCCQVSTLPAIRGLEIFRVPKFSKELFKEQTLEKSWKFFKKVKSKLKSQRINYIIREFDGLWFMEKRRAWKCTTAAPFKAILCFSLSLSFLSCSGSSVNFALSLSFIGPCWIPGLICERVSQTK